MRWRTAFRDRLDVRRRVVGAALLAALILHNLEEGFGFQRHRAEILRRLPFAPSATEAWIALAAFTMVVGTVLLWAAGGPSSRARVVTLRATALVLLANVLIPHLPAAWVLGGYAPGVVSAVLINVPVCGLCLWVLRDAP